MGKLGEEIPGSALGVPIITGADGAYSVFCNGKIKPAGTSFPGNRGGRVYRQYKNALQHTLSFFITHRAATPHSLCLTCFLRHPGHACVNSSYDWTSLLGPHTPACAVCARCHFPPCPPSA